jgi:WD40 repeat protein
MEQAFPWLLKGPLPVDGIVRVVETLAFEFKGIVTDQWQASLALNCVEISHGKLALTRRADIDVRDMSGIVLATCKGRKDMVMCLTSLDNGLWASGSADHDVRIWNSSGREVAVLKGHERAVTRLCALSDGRLASLDVVGNVKVLAAWRVHCLVQHN